jgi:hypothetical protein
MLFGDFAVFRKVVYANDLMTASEKFAYDIASQKAR